MNLLNELMISYKCWIFMISVLKRMKAFDVRKYENVAT